MSLADDPEDWCARYAWSVCTCKHMCPDDRPVACRTCGTPVAASEGQCEKCRDAR